MVPKLRFNETKNTTYSTVTLGDAVQSISSGRSKDCVENGNYKFYGSTGIIGFRSTADYEGTAILIARVGANAGSLYMVNGKYNVSDNTLIVSADTQFINYLYFYLSAINLNKLVYGSGQPLITGGMLKNLKIEIPGTREQTKIADFLSSADEKITLLNKQYDLLCQYKKGMMQKIFSQELRFKDENGDDFDPWNKKTLGSIFEQRSERAYGNEILLSVSINDGVNIFNDVKRKDNSSKDKSNYLKVFRNDIAYNSMRMWQGASGISLYDGIVSPAYTVLKGNDKNCSLFFSYMFKLDSIIFEFQKHSQGLTSDTWNLKYSKLKNIIVTVPCLKEQLKIAKMLSTIDDKIAVKKAELDKLKTWKQGLLQQMFV